MNYGEGLTVHLDANAPIIKIESFPITCGNFTNDGFNYLNEDKHGRFVYKSYKSILRVIDTYHGEARNLVPITRDQFPVDAYFPIDETFAVVCSRSSSSFIVSIIESNFEKNQYNVCSSTQCNRNRAYMDGNSFDCIE
jgi:hypothetical protein